MAVLEAVSSSVVKMRNCPKCEQVKPLTDFSIRKSGPRKGEAVAHCNKCVAARNKWRWEQDPEKLAAIGWRSKIKKLYGLTEQTYNAMLDGQGHACAICESKVSWSRNYKYKKGGSSRFMVDHCHATGRVRGLLCTRCNRALGLLQDSVEVILRAAEYLKNSSKK
jgi:hypothetical protein